jgi:hypothetical protein
MQLTPRSVCKTATGNGATRPIDFQQEMEKRKEFSIMGSYKIDVERL